MHDGMFGDCTNCVVYNSCWGMNCVFVYNSCIVTVVKYNNRNVRITLELPLLLLPWFLSFFVASYPPPPTIPVL